MFALCDDEERVPRKVAAQSSESLLALRALGVDLDALGGWFDCELALQLVLGTATVPLAQAAENGAPRRGLNIDAARLPPYESAVVRNACAAAPGALRTLEALEVRASLSMSMDGTIAD